MRLAITRTLGVALVVACCAAISSAEITSFAGFPAINVVQPGNPSYPGPPTSSFVPDVMHPKWTRAMTDVGGWPTMFDFDGNIFLEFNLTDGHRGTHGLPGATGALVRYRSSDQGNTWESVGSNLGSDQNLGEYVVKGNTLYRYEWNAVDRRTDVSTSTDGVNFTPRQQAYQTGFWLYGTTYDPASDKFYSPPHFLPTGDDESQRQVQLLQSNNGLDWNYVSTIHGPGNWESESVLHIRDDGSMVALIRQKWGPRNAFIATSTAPYTDWSSWQLNLSLEGEHFFEVDGQLFLGSRAFLDPKLATPELIAANAAMGETRLSYTMIYKVNANFSLTPWAVLDSMGDNSYPRAVVTGDEVLFTYYSQHQDMIDKTYLAAFDKSTFLAGPLFVPEPSGCVLAAAGLVGLFVAARRRRREKQTI